MESEFMGFWAGLGLGSPRLLLGNENRNLTHVRDTGPGREVRLVHREERYE
jgi:hypothetical protein